MNGRTPDGRRLERRGRARIAIVAVSAAVGALAAGGCTSARYRASGDPLLDLRNPNLSERDRSEAATVAWGEVTGGVRDRERTRAALKDLAWSQQTPVRLRLSTLDLLTSDPDPAGQADSKRMVSLMLPSEPSRAVVALLSDRTAAQGWTELTPALVRSAARELEPIDDPDRPERRALLALHPGRSLEEVVFGVFLDPTGGPAGEAAGSLRLADRARSAAWELLGEIDPTGARSRELLRTVSPGSITGPHAGETRRVLGDLDACASDLACLPGSAMELEWLLRLRGATDEGTAASNSAWWGEAARAVARLGPAQREGLALRHAEPVRWASIHRPAWAAMSRAELLSTLEQRLDGRARHMRTAEMGPQRPAAKERLRDWDSSIAWGDALAILVIDEALRRPDLGRRLWQQVEVDRRDETTEYGGVIEAVGSPDPDAFRLVLFRPRARDRTDDQRFVASDDLIAYADRSVAVFHQHVQKARNARYAGPSDGDLDHARRSGRSCLVFTSINADHLNADYYQPNGAVIDLGDIRAE